VAKYVKSNAIVFCKNGQTLGVGAGQMSRVDSTRIASIKAQNAGLSLAGSVVASDAYFPFRDGLDVLAQAGAKAVIQPGGSMRDGEVIAAADEAWHRHGGHRLPPLQALTELPSPVAGEGVAAIHPEAIMKILVIGNGGREHALAWRLAQGAKVQKVYVAPGNAGTALEDGVENVAITAIPELIEFVKRESIELTVVGPEAPLAAGVVDAFRAAGLKIFGPTKAAAQLESSKDFAKRFMTRHNIPTAFFETFSDIAQAKAYVEKHGAPIVIKADGLAAGKGVVVAMSKQEAFEAIDMHALRQQARRCRCASGDRGVPRRRGSQLHRHGRRQERAGDGYQQDHKRLLDNDQGPNTGGMGAYSPAPVVTPTIHAKVLREVIQP